MSIWCNDIGHKNEGDLMGQNLVTSVQRCILVETFVVGWKTMITVLFRLIKLYVNAAQTIATDYVIFFLLQYFFFNMGYNCRRRISSNPFFQCVCYLWAESSHAVISTRIAFKDN